MIKNKKVNYGLYLCIFLLMLLCNFLTDMVADDFAYLYSFDTGERITNFFQIFGSIKAHSFTMNGRAIAHFFAQLFLLLPKWIFNFLNSLIFTATIAIICNITRVKERNNLVLLGLFATVWIFTPVFGQVYLWLDGACNYLWAYAFAVLFVSVYTNKFIHNKDITNLFLKIGFLVVSFVTGAYSENASAAAICVATLLLFANFVFFKIKPKIFEILGIVIAFLGYVTLYISPAQWNNKSVEFSLGNLAANFLNALEMYKKFTPILIVLVISIVISIYIKVELKKIIMSLVFFLGSLLSNFMMVLASYYDARSAGSGLVFLLISVFILLSEIFETKYQVVISCLISVALLCSVYYLCNGVYDIYVTHSKVKENEQIIFECKENNELDIRLQMVVPKTEYSAVYGLRYLSPETAETWPNQSMSQYYGVNSLIGYW